MTAIPRPLKPHVALYVRDLDRSVAFYRALFGVEPVKLYHDASVMHVGPPDGGERATLARTGYAKFDLDAPALNLVLNEVAHAPGGSLSHLGVQVADTAAVLAFRERARAAGLATYDEMQVNCCYARQDKTWVADPDGNEWEVFVVLEHLATNDGEPAACCTPRKPVAKACGCTA